MFFLKKSKFLSPLTTGMKIEWIAKKKMDHRGFTLIEIIAVLLLLGILTAVAVPRYMDLQKEARRKVIYAGIAEYNAREHQLWAKYLLADESTDSVFDFDRKLYFDMDPYLDPGHTYSEGGTDGDEGENWLCVHDSFGDARSGTAYKVELTFQGELAYVERAPATLEHPAYWSVVSFEE